VNPGVEQTNQDGTGVPGNLDSDECFKADYDDDEEMPENQSKTITNDPKSEHDIDEQQEIGCVLVLVIRNFNKY
jgi:hypothetical protein